MLLGNFNPRQSSVSRLVSRTVADRAVSGLPQLSVTTSAAAVALRSVNADRRLPRVMDTAPTTASDRLVLADTTQLNLYAPRARLRGFSQVDQVAHGPTRLLSTQCSQSIKPRPTSTALGQPAHLRSREKIKQLEQ